MSETKPQAVLPEGWPRPKGYANGVVAQGRMRCIAGMIGWDAQGVFHTDDFAGQVRQALQNVADVLRAAGGRGDNIVRMTWYVTDKREYLAAAPAIGQAFREIAVDPFAHRARANAYGFTDGLRRLPTENHFDHALSTERGQAGILMDVHSALPQGLVEVSTTSASSVGAEWTTY